MGKFVAEVLDLRDGLVEPRRSTVALSRHAAQRYSERVDFCIGPIEAAARLREDMERSGVIVSTPPEWLLESAAERNRSGAYLVIGEDYVLPLASRDEGFRAVTLIARSHGSHIAQRRKRQRSRKTKATAK